MKPAIIETQRLFFEFQRDQKILNDLNLQVPTGSIYGFLGPNGAGKTTTLRLLLGLLKKQEGNITLFGRSFQAHRLEIFVTHKTSCMQHIILVLAMMLLLGIAHKELTVAKIATDSRLMQTEKVQAAKIYELPREDDDDYNCELNVGSCYTDLFQ